MRIRLKAGFVAAITMVALLGAAPIRADAQVLSDQAFASFGTGTQVSANLLELGDTETLDAQVAFAGTSVDSESLAEAITNEMGETVQPSLPDKNAYGRGSGAEISLLQPGDAPANIILSDLAEASSPPPEGFPDPVTKVLGPLDLGVAFVGLLEGQAQALYAPDVCAIGQPIAYGKGEAANVQLLPTVPGGALGGLVNVAAPGTGEAASQTRSFQYFKPNGDGTFALVSETRQVIAPVTIGPAPLPVLTIRVDGEYVMRVTANGKPGAPDVGPLGSGARIEFSDPLVTIKNALGADVIPPITLQGLLGAPGLVVPIPLLGELRIGGPPRELGGTGPPQIAPDGTLVAAGYDLLSLVLDDLIPLADVRVGHMEGGSIVPEGGVRCNIPVTKTALPDPATTGQDVTVTIEIPDIAKFNQFFACDLLNISATDTHRVLEGNPRFHIVSASNGGIIEGNVVRWPSLGNYTRGSPPIVLTVVVRIDGGTGVIEDIVDVSATLGNCTGGIAGQDIAGQITGDNGAITGSLRHIGPGVNRGGALPPTGGDMKPLLLGGVLLLAALGVRRAVRHSSSRGA